MGAAKKVNKKQKAREILDQIHATGGSLKDVASLLRGEVRQLSQEELLNDLKRKAGLPIQLKSLDNRPKSVLLRNKASSLPEKVSSEQENVTNLVDSIPVEAKDNNSQGNASSESERSGHDADMTMADAKALPAPPYPTPEQPDESRLSDVQKRQLVHLGVAMEALLTSDSYDPLDQKSGDTYMDILFEYPREVREVYLHKRVQELMGKQ